MLRTVPDAPEHPLGHEDAHHLDRLHVHLGPVGEVRVPLANDKPRRPVSSRLKDKRPREVVGRSGARAVEGDRSAQHEMVLILEMDNRQHDLGSTLRPG